MCCCFMGNEEEEVDQAMMMKNEKEKNATRSTIRRVESASLRALKMYSRRRRNARALQAKKCQMLNGGHRWSQKENNKSVDGMRFESCSSFEKEEEKSKSPMVMIRILIAKIKKFKKIKNLQFSKGRRT